MENQLELTVAEQAWLEEADAEPVEVVIDESPEQAAPQAAPTRGAAGEHWLQLRRVRTDGGTQSRVRLDPTIVQDYADQFVLNSNAPGGNAQESEQHWWGSFPALDVYLDGDYWLADGFHRLAGIEQALTQAGLPDGNIRNWRVLCRVHLGSRRAAILHAAGANAAHGLRRTNADKRRAVETLLRDEEWRHWSDAEIARRCAVDSKTVGNARRQLELNREIPDSLIRKRADGAMVNTANVGAKAAPVNYAPVWELETAIKTWLSRADDGGLVVLDSLHSNKDESSHWQTLSRYISAASMSYRKSDLVQALGNVRDQRRQTKAQASARTVYPSRTSVEPEPEPAPITQPVTPPDLAAAGYELVRGTQGNYTWRDANGNMGDYWSLDIAIQDARKRIELSPAPAIAEPVMNEIETLLMPHEALRAVGFVIQRKHGERGVFVFRWSLRDGRFGEWLPLLQEAADQGLRWYGAFNPQPPTESDRHQNSVELLTSSTIDITGTLPMSLHWAIKQATVEDLQVALAKLPPQLSKARGPVLRAALKNRGVVQQPPPVPDPRLEDAQALYDLLVAARDTARAHYGDLTGRHSDMLEFERGIEAMLPPLKSLVETLT